MQCDECGDDLVGTYFEKEGKNICEKDYEVGRVPFLQPSQKILLLILTYNLKFIEDLLRGGSFAPLSVSAAPSVSVRTTEHCIFAESTSDVCSLQKYRKKCSVCGEYIQGSFYTKDDKFICAKDYKVGRKGLFYKFYLVFISMYSFEWAYAAVTVSGNYLQPPRVRRI